MLVHRLLPRALRLTELALLARPAERARVGTARCAGVGDEPAVRGREPETNNEAADADADGICAAGCAPDGFGLALRGGDDRSADDRVMKQVVRSSTSAASFTALSSRARSAHVTRWLLYAQSAPPTCHAKSSSNHCRIETGPFEHGPS